MKNPINRLNIKGAQGFTIVELMIATMIFAVVLLLATFILLQVGRTYYKGITESRTQGVARAIVDDISQAIQFSGEKVIPPNPAFGTARYFCAGNKRYTYVLGTELQTGNNAFMRENSVNNCTVPGAWPATATELLGLRMRLANLTLSQVGGTNLYSINVRVVAGEDDMLCSPSFAGDCNLTTTTTHLGSTDLTCKPTIGTQFCAVAQLSAVVQKRL